MKIESELRYAINAAAKISSKNASHWESLRLRKAAVEQFFKKYPIKRMRVAKLIKDFENAEKIAELCQQKMEKEFGLSLSKYHGDKISNDANFVKAGGKLPATDEFTAEQVVKEYIATKTAAEATAVLKKYGIVWK